MISSLREWYRELKYLEARGKIRRAQVKLLRYENRRPAFLPSRFNISRLAARQRSSLPYPRDRPI